MCRPPVKKLAEIVGVEPGIGKPAPNGTRIFTVRYTFNGSEWKGSIAAQDEMDAFRKFRIRLDDEETKLHIRSFPA